MDRDYVVLQKDRMRLRSNGKWSAWSAPLVDYNPALAPGRWRLKVFLAIARTGAVPVVLEVHEGGRR
jgi:hypothetical protein